MVALNRAGEPPARAEHNGYEVILTPGQCSNVDTVYFDKGVTAVIDNAIYDKAYRVETGGFLAGSSASCIRLATGPTARDRHDKTSHVLVYDGAIDLRLQDEHGVRIIGAWHSHPVGHPATPSDADLKAAATLLDNLRLTATTTITVTITPQFELAYHAWRVMRHAATDELTFTPCAIERHPHALPPAVFDINAKPHEQAAARAKHHAATFKGCDGCGFAYAPKHESGKCGQCRGATA